MGSPENKTLYAAYDPTFLGAKAPLEIARVSQSVSPEWSLMDN